MPTREEFLAAARHGKPHKIEVPEIWSEPVYIRVLSAKDQISLTEGRDQSQVPFRVLVACICNEDGTPILQQGDEDILAEFPFPVILRVFTEAARINGISSQELEEAVAHFEPAQGDSSSSA